MIFTESQPKYNILDLGFDKSLTKALLSQQGSIDVTPELINAFTQGTSAKSLLAGELISSLEQQTGVVFSGKTAFDNAQDGYRLGIDVTDDLVKFYIGNTTNYLNWDGSTLTIAGSISASAIDIPDNVTANSFHVNSSGDAWWGAAAIESATAKVLKTGIATFTDVTITNPSATTITGGVIQTASSGQRIRLVAASAITPTQGANSLMLVNSSDSDILEFGSSASIIMRILPTNDDRGGLLIQNASALALTNRLLEVDMMKSTSSATAVYISQEGTGAALSVNAVNSDQTNYLVNVSGSTYLRNLVEITSAFNSNNSNTMFQLTHTGASGINTLMRMDNAGSGRCVYISATNNSNTQTAFFLTFAGNARVMELQNTYSSNANTVLYVTTNNTTGLPIYSEGAFVSTNFKRMIGSGAATIWVSNGTTPNGNLSGNVGDICLYGTGGQAFYCTGTTNWTGM